MKDSLKPNDVASGFFARFLLFTPPDNDKIPPALPKGRYDAHDTSEESIRNIIQNIEDHHYTLSPSAKSAFEAAHNSIYIMARGYNEETKIILDPYVKRWSPYILKISMIMQKFENPLSKEISDTAINSAMVLILPAIKSTVKLFEGELDESEHQNKCRRLFESICKKVQKGGRSVFWQEIMSSNVLDGGAKEYEYICTTLIESGKLEKNPGKTKKRDTYAPINEMVE